MQNKKSLELTPVSFMVRRRVASRESPNDTIKHLFAIVEEVEREVQLRGQCHSRSLNARLQSIKTQLYQRWQRPGTVPQCNDEFERLLLQIGADFEMNKHLTRGIEANLNKLYRCYQETKIDRRGEDEWSLNMTQSTPLVSRDMSYSRTGISLQPRTVIVRESPTERERVDRSMPNQPLPSLSLPMLSTSPVRPVYMTRPRKRTAQQADNDNVAKMAKFWRLDPGPNQRINNIIQCLPKGELEQDKEAIQEAIGWLLY